MSKTFPTFGPHGNLVPPPLPKANAVPAIATSAGNGKVAIVTGAGRGIGRATAIALAGRGYAVVLIARTETELNETARLCSATSGDNSLVLPIDVRDPAAIADAVGRTLQRFGRIDALVNNAGLAPLGPFGETDAAAYFDVLATNLGATVHFSRAVWETMTAVRPGETASPRGGVIVNVSSESARDPFPGFALYAAAKAGINGFTKALAREAEPLGVRVHCVAPAGVETAMLRKIATTDQVPPESTLAPEAVAKVIAACVVGDLAATSGETIYLHR
ncbi:MAG: putative oxidoreductase [Phycisphaerales bacterium]|nr:putative oxidoreductase [Phycisphaerales bacterium]